MLRTTVIGCILASFFSSAYAVNWESIYSGSAGTIWADRSTLSEERPLIHVRLRMKLSKPDNPGDVTYDQRLVQLTFNCDSWQYTMTSDSKWLRGKLVKHWEGDTDYIHIDPDKPLSEAAKALCSKTYGSVQHLGTV
ncbi:hypothetical protein B0G84_8079 [Paraburkholderia sp. BL8N3]|nr:surface-adhesin E family protein [Paraburkholderia sp. BL8N3]TCK33760.1 hypothetical protein B0G84_8079 [Paraburkholderia sp. BL8N3]